MSFNRRNALKQLVLISAGAALLPSCLNNRSKAAVILKNFSITPAQENLLDEITAAIIPSGATPGAREASAHLFVLKMVDDCMSPDARNKFLNGLQQLETTARTAKDTATLLTSIDAPKMPDTDLGFCYSTIKRLTIQAYTTSKYYLTKVQIYELVPGRFHGCMPVKPQSNTAS